MWKLSDAFLAFAIIALIIGIVLTLCFVFLNDDEKDEDSVHNMRRATLFLLATVALGVLVLVFQRREAAAFVNSMM